MIRAITRDDVSALKTIIDATGLFPSVMLDDMLAHYVSGDKTDEIWLTCVEDGPVAVAYSAPERMTQGTTNLYLIAVHPDYQRQGRGAALLDRMEQVLMARGRRLLLIETSGLADFEGTRSFYRSRGYVEDARIGDFYREGEDKIVYKKFLRKS